MQCLYLVLAFFQAAMIWMLLKAEFLSITLVLVYVGAVMVLFLFVVMMLDINIESARPVSGSTFRWLGMLGLIALEMAAVLMGGFDWLESQESPSSGCGVSCCSRFPIRALGKLLYTEYLYPWCKIAAVILLVAMIAAIALTLRAPQGQQSNQSGK
jgi:NADH-quinone oxidoreductase subunit J